MNALIEVLTNIFGRGHFSTEAPASVNVKYTYRGLDVMLTMRGEHGQEVLERLDAALDYIETLSPPVNTSAPAAMPATPATPEQQAAAAPFCRKHNRPMKESNYGGWYCTAKDESTDSGYCNAKISP